MLLKLLNVEDSNFEHDFAMAMKAKKFALIPKLINKLVGREGESEYWVDDENLNACTVLTQLLEVNEFYKIIRKVNFIEQIAEIAFDPLGSKISQNCARQVLEKLVQKINENGKKSQFDTAINFDADEDTIITKGESDEEEEGAQGLEPQTLNVFTVLISKIHRSLQTAIPEPIQF